MVCAEGKLRLLQQSGTLVLLMDYFTLQSTPSVSGCLTNYKFCLLNPKFVKLKSVKLRVEYSMIMQHTVLILKRYTYTEGKLVDSIVLLATKLSMLPGIFPTSSTQ